MPDPGLESVWGAWCRMEPRPAPAALRLDRHGWQALAERARREGVAGLVVRALASDPAGSLPPVHVRLDLREAAREQAARHAWEQAVLVEVLDALAARGIETVVLRGHALVASVYGGDGSLRPQVDHDVLVRDECLDEARDALVRLAFRSEDDNPDVLVREGTTVDLHRDPYDRPRVPARGKVVRAEVEGVFRRAVPVELAGTLARQPCPEDRLLLLSVHLVKHSFDRLIRLVDVAECWRGLPVDAEVLVGRAREEGTADATYYALAAARARLGADVPAELMERLAPRHRPGVERAFTAVLRGQPSPFFAERLLLHQLERWRDRWSALVEMTWPPEERARIRSASPGRRAALISGRLVALSRRALPLIPRPGSRASACDGRAATSGNG